MIKRFEREDGIGLEYAQNNMFIVRFDEAIEFPEWNVAKFVYNRDGTFTISVMDYVFIDTDDGVKYSTESYFTEKMKNKGLYTIKVDHLYKDDKVMYKDENTENQYVAEFKDSYPEMMFETHMDVILLSSDKFKIGDEIKIK